MSVIVVQHQMWNNRRVHAVLARAMAHSDCITPTAKSVAVHHVPPLPSATAHYVQQRDYVLGVLARRCPWLDSSDRESLFHDAYTVFLEKQRDGVLDIGVMRPAQIRAYLTQTALNKAMDEGKRAGRRRSVPLDADVFGLDPPHPAPALDEALIARLRDGRVREIVAELPPRQRAVIALRYFLDRAPEDVQRRLAISERVYRRELERAGRYIANRFELVRADTFCETRRSLILAYVSGIAGPRRAAEARRHLANCPGCASFARSVRQGIVEAA
jgi:DNA-directed RNA polymerase specialized sigma24 family protein